MAWREDDRVVWDRLLLTRFNERRYHGTVLQVESAGVTVEWDDGEITEVAESDLRREEPGERPV